MSPLDIGFKILKVCANGACGGLLDELGLFDNKILKEIAKEGVKSLVVAPIIAKLPGLMAKHVFPYFRGLKQGEQQQALDALAQMTPKQAVAACKPDIETSSLPKEIKAEIESYVSNIPNAMRRATTRIDDGGVSATLPSQLPRSEREFAQFLPVRPPRFRQGDAVPGQNYVLDTLLGQGGFGEVWKAKHRSLDWKPPLAIKFCLDEQAKASLLRETALLSKVHGAGGHPNIVLLEDTYCDKDPPFLVYEYVAGGDLGAWLASFAGKPPPPRKVVDVLGQTAAGLAFAHQRGIVHRDIKPANILVRRDEQVKVADFGIGALMPEQSTSSWRASPAEELDAAGTPVYTDPERIHERPDPAEDIYSLGVIGVQLLLGNVLRRAPYSFVNDLEAKGVDAKLLKVLATCLDSRERRYKDGAALAKALAPLGEPRPPRPLIPVDKKFGETGSVKQAGASKRLVSWSRVNRALGLPPAKPQSPGSAAAAPAAPPEIFRDRPQAPPMVALPRGSFWMGSPSQEKFRYVDEGPRHKVDIAYGLAVGQYPVTFADWDAWQAGKDAQRANDEGWGRGSRPVINVSWHDAQAYVAWLRELTGKPYRLLSEAEWEYACRAGTKTAFWTGDAISPDNANFDDAAAPEAGDQAARQEPPNVVAGAAAPDRGRTTPVAGFPPNPFGLHDMHGNVWEWVEDAWHANYLGAPADGAPRLGAGAGPRILRGGSWRMGADALRSARRRPRDAAHRSDQVGFRVARRMV